MSEEVVATEETEEKMPFQMSDEELRAALAEPVEDKEPATEETTTETQTETPEPPPVTESEPETVTISKQEMDRLLRKSEQNDKLLAKLGTEVGLLRKQNPINEVEELQKIRDAYIDDPVKAMELYEDFKTRKTDYERQEKEAAGMQISERNKETVTTIIPDFESKIGDIAELLKLDGYDDATVERFKANPFANYPVVLVNLYKRTEAINSSKSAMAELEKLRQENEQLKAKPNRILENIEKEAGKKTITAKPGVQVVEGAIAEKPLHQMSTAELKKLLDKTGG